ncbi:MULTISPECIES: tryptophan 2,3-dioxygenase family protein [unclassified Novosphingobium]|uniref:tryptophan 2,3-dioxygenase family protein n=1 Tax=unclassified Novosphingobium TaxID=2644732 RepID=UPI0012BE76EF|nr:MULTISPECIES: tryptophan 2,3-dioxygenase family protein [unclassified Novosphingobium]MPS68342.1 tryptophan 2,3-dioxygenase [Novosphingobium sp.]WRT95613.1 tryptophan 2,3-dioxygenase family protein [Novosphingobium sp. RL4]
MERRKVYELLEAPATLDYELYLDTERLLSCQKPFDELCNRDELQFQIVHQVEELWMKLMAYTIVEVDEYLRAGHALRVTTLLARCHRLLRMMIDQLDVLETMSPKEYQQIRLQLGNGSGQESPGFRVLLRIIPDLWQSFEATYLTAAGRTVRDIYDHGYAHDEAYVVAEALIELDELFGKFRWHHLFLIHRSIGMGSASLKGRSVDLLQAGAKHRFFPALWDVRVEMTDEWGHDYGRVRESIAEAGAH